MDSNEIVYLYFDSTSINGEGANRLNIVNLERDGLYLRIANVEIVSCAFHVRCSMITCYILCFVAGHKRQWALEQAKPFWIYRWNIFLNVGKSMRFHFLLWICGFQCIFFRLFHHSPFTVLSKYIYVVCINCDVAKFFFGYDKYTVLVKRGVFRTKKKKFIFPLQGVPWIQTEDLQRTITSWLMMVESSDIFELSSNIPAFFIPVRKSIK